MKKVSILLSGILLTSALVHAQSQTTVQGSAQSNTQTQVHNAQETTVLTSGTQLNAELLTQLDAKKVKPGDEFKLRTVKPVMVGGKRVLNKGALLTGRISEVTRAEGKRGTSQMKLTFDEIRNKDLTIPFSATLEQITQISAHNQADSGSDELGIMAQGNGSARSQTSASGGGGLLGEVTNTVGSTTGAVTKTTNNTISSATNVTEQTLGRVIASSSSTVSNATSGVGKGSGLIAISSNTSAEAGASSTLSLTGQNVRIEKGAIFTLRTDKSIDVAGHK